MLSAKQETTSEYHGYAVADKEENSRTLKVYVPELLPFLTGEVWATEIINNITTKNKSGEFNSNLKTSNFITAIYRDNTSNRAFPPDVRAGEQVIVYNTGDSDTWYWKSEGRNDNLRKTETIRYAANATTDSAPDLDDNNTYFFEIDTRRKKHVLISTSTKLGEKHAYLFRIDTDTSTVTLTDDIGNSFIMESEVPRVGMKNSKNSLIDLNKENINVSCTGDITMVSHKGHINIKASKGTLTTYSADNTKIGTGSNYINEVAANSTTTVGGNYNKKIGGTMVTECGSTMLLKSGSHMIQQAGGSWSVTFVGTGSCGGGVGSHLRMKIGRLDIDKA